MKKQKIWVLKGKVVSQKDVKGGYRHLVFRAPRMAESARPGQFVMIRVCEGSEPLLPRPFSIYRAGRGTVEVLYKVIGSGTSCLASRTTGDDVDVTGPLGKPFSLTVTASPMWLIAGGYGVAPMVFFSEYLRKKRGMIKVFIGARDKRSILCLSDFRSLRVPVFVATEDGSLGRKGLVTELVERELKRSRVKPVLKACGPTPMLRAVAELAGRHGLHSEVSLEETMGCGVGVCLSCVCDINNENGAPSQRMICRHGPVFSGDEVLWDRLRKH